MTSTPLTNPVPVSPSDHIDWTRFNLKRSTSPLLIPPDAFCMRLTIDETHLGTVIPHVSNIEFVRWLEVLAIAHAESLGFDDRWYRQHNLIWFVARHEINYLAELLLDDHIIMATWINEISKCRADRRYAIACENKNRIALIARTDWVLVTRDKHKPTRAIPEMITRFRPAETPDNSG